MEPSSSGPKDTSKDSHFSPKLSGMGVSYFDCVTCPLVGLISFAD